MSRRSYNPLKQLLAYRVLEYYCDECVRNNIFRSILDNSVATFETQICYKGLGLDICWFTKRLLTLLTQSHLLLMRSEWAFVGAAHIFDSI